MTTNVQWPLLKRSLIAIIRGIRNDEIEPVLSVLIEEGFEAIEIPLNSPEPWVSIEKAIHCFADQAIIGAGTVLTIDDVNRLADIGGRLMVSPNTDPDVIKAAVERGLYAMPGCYTPTEALLAVKCGASALKFFPACSLKPSGIAAIKTILPSDSVIGVVGGISDKNFEDYAKIGIKTFGLGTSLYRPNDDVETVRSNARRTIEAYDRIYG